MGFRDRSQKPTAGNSYLFVSVRIRNLGPGAIYSFSAADFAVRDATGNLYKQTRVPPAPNCELGMANLIKNKQMDGCVAFEVPLSKSLELIYAPFHLEELTAKRYLSFMIRQ